MRAVVQHRFGGPDVLALTDLPDPRPAAGEVVVAVEAIGLNPVDALIRSGAIPLLGDPPFVIGSDLAGTVVALGDGIEAWRIGDRVFGKVDVAPMGGTYAEAVAVRADQLAAVPAGVGSPTAAALALAGLTAWQALVEGAGVDAGQHVLVSAAGGGVGHLAVQIAKARGARVTATASPAKASFVKGLGADEVVDYTTARLADQVGPVDVVLDMVGGTFAEAVLPLIRPGGALATIVRHRDEALRADVEAAGLRFVGTSVRAHAGHLAELVSLVASGAIDVHIDRSYPLADIAEAHRRLDGSPQRGSGAGITGKLVALP